MEGTHKYFFAAGLSGLLLGLAYPGWSASWRIDLGWLVWLGLVPFFWSAAQLIAHHDNVRKKDGFLLGFITGLVYFLIIFRWFWSVHPLNTLGIERQLISLLGVAAIYVVSSLGMAVFWGLASMLAIYLLRHKNDSKKTAATLIWLAIPGTFVVFEYLRSWGFGFLWAGSGSLFGPHWTLGNLAYALTDNPLALKLVSLVGIYGLTFLIVSLNLLFFSVISKNKIVRRAGLITIIVVAITLTPKFLKSPGETAQKNINYAIIQTSRQTKLNPSPQETLASFKEQLELLDRVAKEHPESQIILFPEASDFFKNLSLFLTPAQAQEYFSKLFKEPRLIIAGGRIMDATTGKAYSRVFSLDTRGDILGFYDKRLVAPGGEFLPYSIRTLIRIFSKDASALFEQVRNLSSGQKETSTVDFRYQFNIAPIICSEAFAPGLIKKIVRNSDVVVSMASYSAFHGTRTIADQMLAITRFRAVENRKPVITAVNMGRSSVIDSRGNIVLLAQNSDPQILTGNVDITQQKSWYNRWGDTPILLGSLMLGIIAFSVQGSAYSKIKTWIRRTKIRE